MRLWWCTFAAAVGLAGLPLDAQHPDRFEAAIRFDRGRFVADRATAKLTLSDRYRSLLRHGVTNAELLIQFCDALDREFRLMAKPYVFTLTDAQKALDARGELDDPEIETRRRWNGTIRDFPGLVHFQHARGLFNEELQRITEHSALAEWLNQDDSLLRPFQFRVRNPLALAELQTPQTGRTLDRRRVIDRLAPLDGLPANPEAIRSVLLDFYTSRGLTPTIDVKLDATPPEVSIFETTRIARILLPVELRDVSVADRIVYNAMPHRVFAAFRREGAALLATPTAADATKREIDLAALVVAAESATVAHPFELPPLDAAALGEVQQRLLHVGYTASTFDFEPSRQLVDLVIDATTPQPGAAAAADPVSGVAETPPNSPRVSSRPNAPLDLQPAPMSSAPTSAPRRSANAPRREQKNFVGGGFEYQPGQGVRALGSFQRRKTMGVDLLGAEGGGMGGGFGSAHVLRDYVWFDRLGRRLTVDVRGGSEFEQQRVLENVLTDERRTGGRLRLDLEAIRNRGGHRWNVFVEGRRESVSLTPVASNDSAPQTRTVNLTAIDVGFPYEWRRTLALHPLSVRIEPALRVGLPVGNGSRFSRLRVGAQYHQSVAGPIEVESRFEARRATALTPVFELPSLGGAESVRGFRSDARVGRHLWTLQSEVWVPVLGSGAPSKFRDFVRRNVRLAAFYDVGRIGGLAAGVPNATDDVRHGTGVGFRVRYQGVIIETDWGYGFGSDETQRPGRGRLYFNFRLP